MRSLNALKSRSINNDTLSKNRISLALNQTATTGASLGGGGGGTSNIDLTAVTTNIVPTTNILRDLGTETKFFKKLYVQDIAILGNILPNYEFFPPTSAILNPDGTVAVPNTLGNTIGTPAHLGNPTHFFGNIYVRDIFTSSNTISIGSAQLKSIGNTLDIPTGSKIGGIAPGTIRINGAVANTSSLPSTNAVGDGYVIDGNLWAASIINSTLASGWVNVGAFRGPKGDTGNTGSTGAKGDKGDTGNPGAKGDTGDQGIQGIQGIQGPPGVLEVTGGTLSGTITIPDLVISGNSVFGKPTLGTPTYRMDVSGSLNASELYQNDVSLGSIYATTSALNSFYSKGTIDSSINDILSFYATKNYVTTQINNLIDGADTTLNTLNEIATAIKNDGNFGIAVYGKIEACDNSINTIRASLLDTDSSINTIRTSLSGYATTTTLSGYATTDSLLSYSTKTIIDASLALYYTKSIIDASLANYALSSSLSSYASLLTDASFAGNIQIGTSRAVSLGINKPPSTAYALDISGDLDVNGNTFLGMGTNRVGINTTSPAYTLDVSGTLNARNILVNGGPVPVPGYSGNLFSFDTSFNGNVQIGSTRAQSLGINKTPSALFALDVSGAVNIVGNLSVTKSPNDTNYSNFDLSNVNLNIFNTIEKFTTLTFNTSTMTMNYSQGSIFYTTAAANFAELLITNVPTTLNRSITVTLIVSQSGTFLFTGTTVTVNNTAINYIKQDGTAFAAPAASRTVVIYQFNIIYASATPTVIAFMTGYA